MYFKTSTALQNAIKFIGTLNDDVTLKCGCIYTANDLIINEHKVVAHFANHMKMVSNGR